MQVICNKQNCPETGCNHLKVHERVLDCGVICADGGKCIVSQTAINKYVLGAVKAMPIKDRFQLDAMVILHFDIPDKIAHDMISIALNKAIEDYEYSLKQVKRFTVEVHKEGTK